MYRRRNKCFSSTLAVNVPAILGTISFKTCSMYTISRQMKTTSLLNFRRYGYKWIHLWHTGIGIVSANMFFFFCINTVGHKYMYAHCMYTCNIVCANRFIWQYFSWPDISKTIHRRHIRYIHMWLGRIINQCQVEIASLGILYLNLKLQVSMYSGSICFDAL